MKGHNNDRNWVTATVVVASPRYGGRERERTFLHFDDNGLRKNKFLLSDKFCLLRIIVTCLYSWKLIYSVGGSEEIFSSTRLFFAFFLLQKFDIGTSVRG